MKRGYVFVIQGALATAGAFLRAKLSILYSLLCILKVKVVLNYLIGRLASQNEAIDFPGDAGYGWNMDF